MISVLYHSCKIFKWPTRKNN